jgi:hypothetical protein
MCVVEVIAVCSRAVLTCIARHGNAQEFSNGIAAATLVAATGREGF